MVRIFRAERRDAIARDRVFAYLRYFIGEVLLVVVGILIALQIDNWNNDREVARTLANYLNSIARNIRSDLAELESLRDQRESNLLKGFTLDLLFYKSSPYAVEDINAFTSNFEAMRRQIFFIPDTSGFEALKSSGVLDRLQGEDIDRLLSSYYDTVTRIINYEQNYNAAIAPLAKSLYETAKSEGADLWYLFDPSLLTPEESAEVQPYYKATIQSSDVRLLLTLQLETIQILRQYRRATNIGRQLVQMVEEERTNFNTAERAEESEPGQSSLNGNPRLIADGAISYESYLLGFASNLDEVTELSVDSIERHGDFLRIHYPGGKATEDENQWAAFSLTVWDTGGGRRGRDYSGFSSLLLELRGERGGERLLVNLKDSADPDDGSQTNVELTLSEDWQTYEIPLSEFKTADTRSLFVVLGLLFLDQFDPVAFHIREATFMP